MNRNEQKAIKPSEKANGRCGSGFPAVVLAGTLALLLLFPAGLASHIESGYGGCCLFDPLGAIKRDFRRSRARRTGSYKIYGQRVEFYKTSMEYYKDTKKLRRGELAAAVVLPVEGKKARFVGEIRLFENGNLEHAVLGSPFPFTVSGREYRFYGRLEFYRSGRLRVGQMREKTACTVGGRNYDFHQIFLYENRTIGGGELAGVHTVILQGGQQLPAYQEISFYPGGQVRTLVLAGDAVLAGSPGLSLKKDGLLSLHENGRVKLYGKWVKKEIRGVMSQVYEYSPLFGPDGKVFALRRLEDVYVRLGGNMIVIPAGRFVIYRDGKNRIAGGVQIGWRQLPRHITLPDLDLQRFRNDHQVLIFARYREDGSREMESLLFTQDLVMERGGKPVSCRAFEWIPVAP